jgi:cytochrome c-type biogenesis protein CcmH
MSAIRLLLALLVACAALTAATAAAAQQTTLADIEDEVMCTICGTTLALSDAPSANRQRAFINDLIAEGKSKEEIKDALVAEYGPEVLAVPDSRGFDLIGGWLLPAIAVLVAAVLVVLAALRWRLQRDLDRYG